MLCNNSVHNIIKPIPNILNPLLESLHIPILKKPNEIRHIKLPSEFRRILHQLPHHLLVLTTRLTHNHSRNHIIRQRQKLSLHIHRLASLRLLQETPEEGRRLLPPHGTEEVQCAAAEKLGHTELLHELPVGSVGGEGEVLGAIGHGGFRSGSYDARDGAEEEMDDGSVASGEFVKSLVRDGSEKVKVSYDGEEESDLAKLDVFGFSSLARLIFDEKKK
ncbi:Cytochrome P450 93A3 [Senna tora]|uniref:Cytochrome P450 93A3 n=1 Tax=Senna tora TaxID=362788 RepID=A0A834TDE1_9FABA|nr:Cytochrome P450 93A3 [Senna tora]